MKIIYIFLLVWGSIAIAQEDPILRLPARSDSAMTGSAFLKKIAKMDGGQREKAMVQEILKGNVPSFLRKMTPIDSKLSSGPYKGKTLRYWTIPDYIAIGSDKDFVRVPLNLPSIEKISEALDLSLPTAKMVDEIYSHATVKLSPKPIAAKANISATINIAKHNDLLIEQISHNTYVPGTLVAGHKKDVVQSRRILKKPGSIAIYGWHRKLRDPIQPLSTAHSAAYADYSHGIRLISNVVKLGNQTFDLRDILANKSYATLLSSEGAIPQKAHAKSAQSLAMVNGRP